MKDKNTPTTAEIADRHRRLMALAMLAIGMMYLSKALIFLFSETPALYLDYFQGIMAGLTLALLSPILIWKVRHRSASERFVYFSKDGFAAQALMFAQKRSWAITFVLLAFLEPLGELFTKYPLEFVLQIVLAIMLCSMSLLFLYKTRSDEGLAIEGGEASHA